MAGVYTATFSSPGYWLGVVNGVVVPTDTIAIQALALTPIGPPGPADLSAVRGELGLDHWSRPANLTGPGISAAITEMVGPPSSD